MKRGEGWWHHCEVRADAVCVCTVHTRASGHGCVCVHACRYMHVRISVSTRLCVHTCMLFLALSLESPRRRCTSDTEHPHLGPDLEGKQQTISVQNRGGGQRAADTRRWPLAPGKTYRHLFLLKAATAHVAKCGWWTWEGLSLPMMFHVLEIVHYLIFLILTMICGLPSSGNFYFILCSS